MGSIIMERVDIKQVRPNPDNPRFIKGNKFEKLVKSIKEFPQMLDLRPIVVNQDMIVLGGNMRLKACEEAGLKEVPIIFADNLTPEQEKEFIIKDNSSFGEWDWDLLANEWNTDQLDDWGLDIPNFDIEEPIDETFITEWIPHLHLFSNGFCFYMGHLGKLLRNGLNSVILLEIYQI